MKFTQGQLERFHSAIKKINELNLGDYQLADRLALYDKSGEVVAIAIKESHGKYILELIEEELIKKHEEEVNNAREVDVEEPY
jgi:hypothetical protein